MADELLLKPTRLTAQGRGHYKEGNGPGALEAFTKAAAARPDDPQARFNLADALYKNGKFDEAEAHYQGLAGDVRSPLAAPARYNLGNTLFQKKDYPGAVRAYRDALRLLPGDADTRRNLEMALRAQQQQQQQQKPQQPQGPQDKDQKDQKEQKDQSGKDDKQGPQDRKKQEQAPPERPKTEEEKERERYEKEAGMPKERAMQLLEALQQNEKAQQRKQRAARAKRPAAGKDW